MFSPKVTRQHTQEILRDNKYSRIKSIAGKRKSPKAFFCRKIITSDRLLLLHQQRVLHCMYYQLCLTMFQESLNNLMVKQEEEKKKPTNQKTPTPKGMPAYI